MLKSIINIMLNFKSIHLIWIGFFLLVSIRLFVESESNTSQHRNKNDFKKLLECFNNECLNEICVTSQGYIGLQTKKLSQGIFDEIDEEFFENHQSIEEGPYVGKSCVSGKFWPYK